MAEELLIMCLHNNADMRLQVIHSIISMAPMTPIALVIIVPL